MGQRPGNINRQLVGQGPEVEIAQPTRRCDGLSARSSDGRRDSVLMRIDSSSKGVG